MVTERKQHYVQQRNDVNGRITIPGSFNCFKALLALSCIISIHADGAQEVRSRSPHTSSTYIYSMQLDRDGQHTTLHWRRGCSSLLF